MRPVDVVFLSPLLCLAACSTPNAGTGGTSGASGGAGGSTSTPADLSGFGDGPGGASDGATSLPYYVPAGYTLVPFLSDTATYSFDQAEPVLTAGKDYLAVLETDAGRMVFDLYEMKTPITVNSFVFLALNHFYDGIAFHRVIDGFVAQGGDPNTLGTDTSYWGGGGPGYYFGLEIVDGLNFDSTGIVGMARASDPGSNGSQFYITLAPAPSLDTMYTVFANVTEGLDVLPKIVRGEPPTAPTRMQRVYIVAK